MSEITLLFANATETAVEVPSRSGNRPHRVTLNASGAHCNCKGAMRWHHCHAMTAGAAFLESEAGLWLQVEQLEWHLARLDNPENWQRANLSVEAERAALTARCDALHRKLRELATEASEPGDAEIAEYLMWRVKVGAPVAFAELARYGVTQ